MILSVTLFALFSIVAYVCISVFSQLTGGSPGDFWEDVLAVLKPVPLLVLLLGNLFFAAALSIGFGLSHYAVPIAIATGVIVSFTYSALFLGGAVTIAKIAGIALILGGIYLLR